MRFFLLREKIGRKREIAFPLSTRTISAEGCVGQIKNAISPTFRALDTHDLPRGLRGTKQKRNLTCISRPRHARSPQKVARDQAKTQSHLHFAPSTRTISANGCVGPSKNAISPAFRALDTHNLRRRLRAINQKCNLSCVSRPHTHDLRRGLRMDKSITQSHLHLAPLTRAVYAEGCAGPKKCNLTCISGPRHARSPQKVARDQAKTQFRLHFAPSTRTISANVAWDQAETQSHLQFAPSTRTISQRVARDQAKTQLHLHFAPWTRAISAEGCVSWCSCGTAPALMREDSQM